MTARDFADRLKEVKTGVSAGVGDDELRAALARVGAAFKASTTPDAFKAALESDAAVDSILEEEMTTLWMSWMRFRSHASD